MCVAFTASPISTAFVGLSVADFGTDLTIVERKLSEIFQIASRWQAVVHFDEPDTFLEACATEGNLKRNAMASGLSL